MKTCLLALGFLSLSFSAHAQEAKAPNKIPTPTPGKFELKVKSGERERTYTHPSKGLSDISRAVLLAKKAKDGDVPIFEAVFTINDQVFTFSDPAGAAEACKALTLTMRDLPKMRMGLGDLGEIPELSEEDKAAAGDQANPAKSKAAAMAEVRRRINAALQKQLAPSGGRSRQPRMPNPLQMQKTIQQELEKARQEGLLPSQPAAGGFQGGDPRESRKEAIVQNLAFVLGRADSVEKASETETPEEKPE